MGSPRRQARRTTRRSCRTNVTIPNASLDAERIVEACKQLTAGSRFLNIGAGFGFFSRAAKARGFDTTALQPTLPCREVFKHMNGFEPVTAMLTSEFVRTHTAAFDVVLMSQVRRVACRVPIPLVGTLAGHAMTALLGLSDRVGGGMFINAYLRKDKRP